jgi:Tol biopolymer transport system component
MPQEFLTPRGYGPWMRRVLRVLALLGVVGVSAAGAAPSPQPQVAFKQFPGDRNAIVLLDQLGGNALELTKGKPQPSLSGEFSWVPDGSRLAYPGGSFPYSDIYTVGADGRDLTRLTFDAGDGRVYDGDAAWSPDGTRIAYRKTVRVPVRSGLFRLDDEIWIMGADGRDQHALTHDAGHKYSPRWSPNSAQILYARLSPAGKFAVYVVDAVSGKVAFVGRGDSIGAWSPDGSRIAVHGARGIDVINADGTGRVTIARDAGNPSWSPDGSRIAFTRARSFQQSRYYTTTLASVYVVGADGRGERRLTGPLPGEKGSTRDGTPYDSSRSAVWWPDGSRLFFSRSDKAYVMNGDGTCEQPFGPRNLFLGEPAWRPGASPSLPPTQCVALVGGDVALRDQVGVRDTARFRITVANDGNETAHDVVVTLRLERGRGQIRLVDPSCHATECHIASLGPGRFVEFIASVTRPSPPAIHLESTVRATKPDGGTVTGTGLAGVGVRADCDIVGTPGRDTIVGTPRPDRVCALAGADRIVVRGGGRDTVDCGAGKDVVVADRLDSVASNCERRQDP